MKLGSAIGTVATPIARTLDNIWGIDLQNCSGCKKMESDLNNAQTLWDFADAIQNRFRSEKQKENNANTREHGRSY